MNNFSRTAILIQIFLFLTCVSCFAQNGEIDSTYGNYGKQNFANFHPYLYYDEGVTMLPQTENSYLLMGDIFKTDDAGKMWLPMTKFSNDVIVNVTPLLLSDIQQNFFIKTTIAVSSGFSNKFMIAGERNGDLFLKQYDADGNSINYFGDQSEVVRDLGGSEYVSSVARLSDGSFIVFARTTSKIVCLKLKEDGKWDNTFGVGGKLEISVSGDFKVFSAVNAQDNIFFSTGIQKLHKMNKSGIEDLDFNALANQYADLTITNIQVMPDGGILMGGNELFSPKSLILLKLNPDGSLANNFGTQGKTLINYKGNFNTVSSVRIFKNRIYVAGGIDLNFYLAKVSMDGFLVDDFGTGGLVKVKFGNSFTNGLDVKLNNNGTALVLGSREGWLAAVRLKVANVPNVSASISHEFVCPGDVFQLTASGANAYHWVGSDGFESNNANPSLSISESFGGTEVRYVVTGQNADGFTDEAEATVFLKNDINLTFTNTTPCFGETTGQLVTVKKGPNFDANIQLNYNSNLANKVSEDEQSIVFSFDQISSPLELSFEDTLSRYCNQAISVDFSTHAEIKATLEINTIDSFCIGIIDPLDESVPLNYKWSSGSVSKIASDLPPGPFSVTITNTANGCTAVFEDECSAVLSSKPIEINANAIFPNPASEELNVILDNSFNDASLTIMDSQGKIIVSQKVGNQIDGIHKINVGDLSAGLYYIKVQNTQNKLFTGKFVKITN